MTNSKKESYPFSFYGFKLDIPGRYYLLVYIMNVILISAVILGAAYLLGRAALPVGSVGLTGRGVYKVVDKIIQGRSNRSP